MGKRSKTKLPAASTDSVDGVFYIDTDSTPPVKPSKFKKKSESRVPRPAEPMRYFTKQANCSTDQQPSKMRERSKMSAFHHPGPSKRVTSNAGQQESALPDRMGKKRKPESGAEGETEKIVDNQEGKKRKVDNKATNTIPLPSNKSKSKGKQKEKDPAKAALREERRKINRMTLKPLEESPFESQSIGLQPTDLQITYLADKQKQALSTHSDLELEALQLEERWLVDVAGNTLRGQFGAWLGKEPRPLSGAIETLKAPTDLLGAPLMIVVSSSALRVLELIRQVRPWIPDPAVSGGTAKLFSRHQPFSKHLKLFSNYRIAIAVGTPDRLGKLLAENALKLERLEWVVLDVTWQDAKEYSLLDTPERGIKEAVWKDIIGYKGLRERFATGQTRIVAF